MKFFTPSAFWFLSLVPLLVLMYILKQRFEEREVSSLYLWQQVLMDTEASSPFQKLRKNILFFLQLLILLLIVLALSNPFLWWKNKNYTNIILAIDTSGSMSALGEEKIRLEEAKEKAISVVNSLSGESKITLITSGRNNKVEISGSFDKKEVINKIKSLEKTNAAGNIEEAYSLVKAISSQLESYKVIYITDKLVDLKDLNGEIVSVASTRDNISLDYIAHSNTDRGVKVMVRATNQGIENSKVEICLYGEEDLIEIKEVELMTKETKTIYFDEVPDNNKFLYAEIAQKDALVEDNIIYTVTKQKSTSSVLLVTEKNVFLEKLLKSMKDIDLYKTLPEEKINRDFDLYIYDGSFSGEVPKTGNIFFINPNSSLELFKVKDEVKGGKVTVNTHGITKYMGNSNITVSKFHDMEMPYWASSLMQIEDKTISFAGQYKGQKIGVLGFDIHNSDLALTTEFPIFINNIMSYLLDRDIISSTRYNCGDSIDINPIPEAEKIFITTPDKKKIEVSSKYPVKPFEESYKPGIYEISQSFDENEISKLIAVNFPPSESDINYEKIEGSEAVSSGSSKGGLNLKNLFILLTIIVLCIEWLVYIKNYGSRKSR